MLHDAPEWAVFETARFIYMRSGITKLWRITDYRNSPFCVIVVGVYQQL